MHRNFNRYGPPVLMLIGCGILAGVIWFLTHTRQQEMNEIRVTPSISQHH